MNRSARWKLRHWIIAGYSVPIVALLICAGVVIRSVSMMAQLDAEANRASETEDALDNLALNIQIYSRATRGYLLDKNTVSFNSQQEARRVIDEQAARLDELIQDSEQLENFTQLTAALQNLKTTNQELIDLVDQGKVAEAIQAWRNDQGREQAETTTAIMAEMQDRERAVVEASDEVQAEALANLKTTLLLAAGISVTASVALGLWIINRTSHQMVASASAIASSTTEIAATIEQQERTANQQAVSVNETTTTMDELGASSRQSAEQAEAAAAGAKQALVLAGGGTEAVNRTIGGMSDLKTKVEAIADQILRLSEQTSQIGSISGLVSDLANQTNMLALNAAVEAVRAGEHGKGFAVVAAEIRKLADQSRKSAEKINTLVNDIQAAINSTVMVTDEGTKTVDEGVRIAEETASSFAGVADAVNNVVLNSQQISLNIKQQAIAIQQVVDAMNTLNVAARENANGIGQIRIGTERLNEAAIELKAVV